MLLLFREIQQLLGVSFGRPVNEDDDISHASRHRRSIIHLDSYLLIVKLVPIVCVNFINAVFMIGLILSQ